MTKTQNQKTFTLYGNLGADPKSHSLPARSGIATVYDPIIDDIVEREFDQPELNFLTFSVAVGGYGDLPTRWINCVDWEGCAFRMRKGDRVKLEGYFEERTYTDKKTGEAKAARQFVVLSASLAKLKTRQQIA